MDQKKCLTCFKSHKLCICNYINRLECKQKIVILQHPKERFHPFNTAIIAKLSLPSCQIIIDEDFTKNEKLNLILENENCLLVYPSTDNTQEKLATSSKENTLIFIDASWKKANKIFFLSKNLQQLDRLSIKPEKKSIYEIRKSSREYSLSTIEAISYTLEQSHGEKFDSLLFPLKKMIEYTKSYQGDKYETI